MAKASVKLSKKSSAKQATRGAKGDPANYLLQDNEDGSVTVQGVDVAGAAVDISSVATITATSDNTGILTVDPPSGTTFACHGVQPGSANVTITATWNDGSVGPFTFVLPCTVGGSKAAGLTVTLGVPTVRP